MTSLPGHLRRLHKDEDGQTAIAMVIVFLGVFTLFGLALDGGLWYFDHRNAQNEVDAAVLAALQEMPTTDTSMASLPYQKAQQWLGYNGVGETLTISADCNAMTPNSARIVFGEPSGS